MNYNLWFYYGANTGTGNIIISKKKLIYFLMLRNEMYHIIKLTRIK